MNRGGAGLAASASSRLDTVGVLVGVAVVAMSGAVPGIGKSPPSASFLSDGLDVGATERSTRSRGASVRPLLGDAVQAAAGGAVGLAVASFMAAS